MITLANQPVRRAFNTHCRECGITLAVPGCDYCQVCDAMIEAVQTPYMINEHLEWHQENQRRAKQKRSMLEGPEQNKGII